jgi:hypothetical protein
MRRGIDWPMWLLAAFVVGVLSVIAVGALRTTQAQRRECLARGGEFVDGGRASPLCLKPGSVLR